MSYKFQKILLTIELIVVVAVTLYTGTYAAVDQEKVAVAETAETKKSETVKESESKKASETKKSKETQKKDKKKETEPETKTQQVVENKVKSENKKNSTNNSTTGLTKNNSSTTSGGTASTPATSTKPSGNNNSNTSGTNHNASAPSGGISSKPNASTPSTTAPSTPQTEAPEPVRPQTPETTHTHNWVESTHEEPREEGHWGEKVIKDAWDEPIYEITYVAICNGCNTDITDCIDEHAYNAMMSGNLNCGAYTPVPNGKEVVGYISHEAETEPIWIVDRTWTETVGDGYYICSECRARK